MTKTATFREAESGTPFTDIDPGTMPPFDPSAFRAEDGTASRLADRLTREFFPLVPDLIDIKFKYEGIQATDLFSLNTLLGSTIENELVRCLNSNRRMWDPEGALPEYRFHRSSESFPDVRLAKHDGSTPVLGVELKSWFLLSKEGEPSFRYRTASAACAAADLICVLPWYLNNAVSGKPILTTPWTYPAKAASEFCKRHWTYLRHTDRPETIESRGVDEPANAAPYCDNRESTNYRPRNDPSGNFGRLSRTRLMDGFIKDALKTEILGIPAESWMRFLKIHSEKKDFEKIRKEISGIMKIPESEKFRSLMSELKNIKDLIPPDVKTD